MPVIYKALSSNSSTEKEKHGREKGVEGKGRRKKEKRLYYFLEIISNFRESKFLAK